MIPVIYHQSVCFGDVIFSLFDFWQILLNKSECRVSNVYSICTSFMSNERTTKHVSHLGINVSPCHHQSRVPCNLLFSIWWGFEKSLYVYHLISLWACLPQMGSVLLRCPSVVDSLLVLDQCNLPLQILHCDRKCAGQRSTNHMDSRFGFPSRQKMVSGCGKIMLLVLVKSYMDIPLCDA